MSKLLRSGPGLVCIGFVATSLIIALLKGGLSSYSIKDDPSGLTYDSQIHQQEPKEMDAAGEDGDPMTQSRGAAPATAASEVLGKKETVNDVENHAVGEGDFAVRVEDFMPFLLAPDGGYVVKDLGEELIHRHAITEFEKKVHN